MNCFSIFLTVVGLLASHAEAMAVSSSNCPAGCPSGSQCVWNGVCTSTGNCAHYCSVNTCPGSYVNMVQVSCQSGRPCVYRAECSPVSGGLNPMRTFSQQNTVSAQSTMAQLQSKSPSLDVKAMKESMAKSLKFTPPTIPGWKPRY